MYNVFKLNQLLKLEVFKLQALIPCYISFLFYVFLHKVS